MKLIFSIITAILLSSCSNSSLVSPLETCDSMVVHFTQGGNGAAIKTSGTTETHAIQTILQFADGDKTDQYKCASDGSILFYRKSKPAGEISFNFSADGCHHFLHLTQKTPVATKMSNEAVDFLIALANQSK